MKLIIILVFITLQSCIVTKGVNTSNVFTDNHGTTISVDKKYTHTTDIYMNYKRYLTIDYIKNHYIPNYILAKYGIKEPTHSIVLGMKE